MAYTQKVAIKYVIFMTSNEKKGDFSASHTLVLSVSVRNGGVNPTGDPLHLDVAQDLAQAEAGMSIKELCRSGGFSQTTLYKR